MTRRGLRQVEFCPTKVLSARRVRLNRGGYAPGKWGQYYGHGAPLYAVEVQGQSWRNVHTSRGYEREPNGCDYDTIMVRASDNREARAKALAEAQRQFRGLRGKRKGKKR